MSKACDESTGSSSSSEDESSITEELLTRLTRAQLQQLVLHSVTTKQPVGFRTLVRLAEQQQDYPAPPHLREAEQPNYPSWIQRLFNEIDLDGDGLISATEFQRALKGKRKDKLRAAFSAHSADWKPVAARIADSYLVDLPTFHRGVYRTKVVVVGDAVCRKVRSLPRDPSLTSTTLVIG